MKWNVRGEPGPESWAMTLFLEVGVVVCTAWPALGLPLAPALAVGQSLAHTDGTVKVPVALAPEAQ